MKRERDMCEQLKRALGHPALFDVVGGCGINMSEGASPCMGAAGLWFRFCPFCGSEIRSECGEDRWEWWEEEMQVIKDNVILTVAEWEVVLDAFKEAIEAVKKAGDLLLEHARLKNEVKS